MNEAHSSMARVEAGQGNRFQVMKYSNSTTIGKDGKPISETFQTNTRGAIGPDGKKITERHQMYENTGTGF